ncbi:BON domain-containing protein [Paraburkholderia dipogonis]|jgi:osmotically-inducible protein OsmY|uniref:BON domain-containing protein n=1 Tax=Paraburkholderia dipogonis TaxID=1211383 RepID=UPI0038B793CE
MRLSIFTVTCGLIALLSTDLVFAQTASDANAPQSTANTSKSAIRAQNRQLSKAVRHALYATKGLTSSNIAVLVKGGVVSLVGTVPDSSQIQLAGDAAKRVPQVQSVDNRLVLEEEGAQ